MIISPPLNLIPDAVTLPSAVKWKLLDEISIFSSEPDMYCNGPPRKNLGVLISTFDPLIPKVAVALFHWNVPLFPPRKKLPLELIYVVNSPPS